MNTLLIILIIYFIFSIIIVVIYEHNNLRKIFYWSLLCLFFPPIGFISYVIFGNNLKFKSKQKLLLMQKTTKKYISKTSWFNEYHSTNSNINSMAEEIKNKYKFDIWNYNKLKIFISGKDFIYDLIMEIKRAKSNINLEFYIFSDDDTGKLVAHELIEKAKQGIKINIIYDTIGSNKTKKHFWQNLEKFGINVYPFFPNTLNIPHINLKINHRNHRKLIIIDGKISYTGGINIRNDHLGIKTHLSPWRDTQIKIKGPACYPLQDIFLNDFAFVSGNNYTNQDINKYFPVAKKYGNVSCQIIESGPEKDVPYIYKIYTDIINSCHKFLYIQSPYFVIDDNMINIILYAKKRGVDVKIIIPKKPDKKLVYGASLLCLKQLLKNDVDIYLYNGFIHSKTLCTELVASIGSCNFDNRSFFLNFENTCLFYDINIINNNKKIFENDIKNSINLTKKKYSNLKIKNLLYILLIKLISKLL